MTEEAKPVGAVLGRSDIKRALDAPVDDRLIVMPLLNRDLQIGVSSVDLRLGREFIVAKRANLASLSPLVQLPSEHLKWQDPLLVPLGNELVLHPGDLILGSTLEYIRLPSGLAAYVTSRSSWGRAGLVIATAIAIHPGYRGIITLELTNVGNVPLRLYPGVRIAQIIFHRATGRDSYEGTFACPTSPSVGSIREPDIDFWRGGHETKREA